MRSVIVEGSATSHGGRVLTGSARVTVSGRRVARIGDRCTCPDHGACVIVEGDTTDTIDGVPVAYEGHKTSCGAVLLCGAKESGKD